MQKSTITQDIKKRLAKDKKVQNPSNDDYKYSVKNFGKHPKNYEKRKPKSNEEMQSNIFCFQSWNHSLRVKFFAEALFVFIISICLFICIRSALDKSKYIDSLETSYNMYNSQIEKGGLSSSLITALRQQQQQVWNQILSETQTYLSLITQVWTYCILMTPFFLKDIQQIVYANLRMKASSYSKGILIISIINVALATELTYSLFFDYKTASNENDPDYYYKVYKASHYESPYWSLQHTFGVLLAFQFTRIFLFLTATRAFGPMLHIIISMHIEVIKISLIELSIIIIFFCFGRVCFYTIPEFDSDIHAFSTLLQVSLGNIDMTIFDNPNIKFSKYYGYFFLYAFICLSTVTLLNFVVGIITTIYDSKSKIGMGLYLKTVITMRHVYDSDDTYSSIAFMVPPLNLITFLFTPAVIWFGSKRLNKALLHICFFPIMITGATLFILISLLLSPIVYFITLEKLLKSLCSSARKEKSKATILLDIMIFALCGGFILVGQVAKDTASFISDLYEDNLTLKFKTQYKKSDPRLNTELDYKFFTLFLSFLHDQKQDSMPSKQIIKKLANVLNIEKQIYNLLYSNSIHSCKEAKQVNLKSAIGHNPLISDSNDFRELVEVVLQASTSKHILQQFNILKRIINDNSIPNEAIPITQDQHLQLIDSKLNQHELNSQSNFVVRNLEISSQISIRTIGVKRPLGYIQNIFYIKEFLELTKEIQVKSVFKQMINMNKFHNTGIKKFTKPSLSFSFMTAEEIHHKSKSFLSTELDLALVSQSVEYETPKIKTLELISANRNYNVIKSVVRADQNQK